MSNCSRIRTTARERLLDRSPQPIVAILPGKHQHLDHLPGAALLAMPIHQRLPDLIETGRPKPSPALLLQRPRSRQCARFAIKHIEIMFQVEDLLLAPITARVARHTAAGVPEFHPTGIDLGMYFS